VHLGAELEIRTKLQKDLYEIVNGQIGIRVSFQAVKQKQFHNLDPVDVATPNF